MSDVNDQVLVAVPAAETDPGAAVLDGANGWPRLSLGRAAPVVHVLISGDFPIPVDRAAALGVSFDEAGWEGVLMGGLPLTTRTGAGALRWIDPAGVVWRALMLERLDLARCLDDWDPAYFVAMGCGDWSDDPAEIAMVMDALAELRHFFAATAARRDGVVTYVR